VPGVVVALLVLCVSVSGAYAAQAFSRLPAEMSERRYEPAVVALPNGRVLIAGGHNFAGGDLKSVELFNPESSTFEKLEGPTHELVEKRAEAGAVLLPSGKVLIAGGFNNGSKYLMTAELFNPETNTFEKLPTEMTARRAGPAAVLLPSGNVLIAGGASASNVYPKSAELYNPEKQTFEALPAQMSTERYAPAAALLPDGKVLIADGYNETTRYLKSAELFNPATGIFENLSAEMMTERDEAATAVLPNGRVLIAGGVNNPQPLPDERRSVQPGNERLRKTLDLTDRTPGRACRCPATGREGADRRRL
jgi:hypothetical protein